MNTHSHRFACLIGSIVFLSSFALAAGTEDRVQRSFSVEPGGMLSVKTQLGSIRVQSGAGDRVEVEVVRKSRSGDQAEFEELVRDLRMDFEQRGNDVYVEVEFDRRLRWGGGLNLEFFITVPYNYDVDLKTSGGSIEVADLQGTVEAETSGGSLKFGKIVGTVDGHTSGGSIVLEGSAGSANLKTSGGSITMGEVEGDVVAHTSGGSIQVDEVFGSVDASTSGGSIRARISSQPRGDCRLTTSGGSITVELAGDVGLDLDAKTSSGRVIADLPVNRRDRGEKYEMMGEIGGGGPRLYLRTSGGNIHLRGGLR